jgi:hypothetical protein
MVIFKEATLLNKIKIHYRQRINLKNYKITNSSIQYLQHKILQSEIQGLSQSTIKIKLEFKTVLDHHSLL